LEDALSTLPYSQPPFRSALQLFQEAGRVARTAVNIGASDGCSDDPLWEIYQTGAGGLAIEADATKCGRLGHHLPHVTRIIERATPGNLAGLIRGNVHDPIDVVSIDVDSFDHYLLEQVLKFRPRLIMIEINESMPDGVFFYLLYDPSFRWSSGRFFGCSLDVAHFLAARSGYRLIQLDWNIAFFARRDFGPFPALTTQQTWRGGYWDRPDRSQAYWWDQNPPDISRKVRMAQLTAIREDLSEFFGRYELFPTEDISADYRLWQPS
jgi:hypothetical protein